jgi:hypothetical protein
MTYFNTSKSPCLVSQERCPGSCKQPLIQQIAPVPFLRNFHWGGGGGKTGKNAERKL